MLTKIILADDHCMFREMLLNVLAYRGENCVVMAEAANATETLDLLGRYLPDLLLLDYKMPGLGRLSVFCKEAIRCSPQTRIIVLSGYSNEEIVVEAALGGAKGYIVKGASVADLLNAIKVVQMGGLWVDPNLSPSAFHAFLERGKVRAKKVTKLSRRELQILSHVAQRISNRDIGSRLHIDKRTVKNHLTHIFTKLGVSNREEASRVFFH
jgi:DNA-binding NarL/FixJ family response regulator